MGEVHDAAHMSLPVGALISGYGDCFGQGYTIFVQRSAYDHADDIELGELADCTDILKCTHSTRGDYGYMHCLSEGPRTVHVWPLHHPISGYIREDYPGHSELFDLNCQINGADLTIMNTTGHCY